jgi:uncharacterized protein YbbC (DUF1343 family)
MPTPRVQPGIVQLLNQAESQLRHQRIGVLSGPSGILPDLTPSTEALIKATKVQALFGPEHGLYGAGAEAALIGHSMHPSGIPIYSLYGQQLVPTAEQLAGLDTIICDIQDIGCRYYTYAWTIIKLMETAAQHQIRVVITDRPNPLGGEQIEGPALEAEQQTLVGLHNVPVRHGLTLGELALLVNHEKQIGCDLTVIPCEGWQRNMLWADTGLPWVAPSPNMPSPQATITYPGICLGEGTNLSVGRGTALPFEQIGAPWIDAPLLAETLNAANYAGVRWRPVAYDAGLEPYTGQRCFGVQAHVIDPQAYRSVLCGVGILVALRQTHPQFEISAGGSVYADPEEMKRRMYNRTINWNTAHFDRLAGSSSLREQIEQGWSAEQIAAQWQANEQQFAERRAPFLLYQ